ncbi:MAG: LysM peptidoglycan-binding domain-containing protein [Gemmatimonadetes bacterium]|nr:LysM peptidoglycan-binding domain-containing protein [Gemmatimonadota bacterium]
MAGDSAAPTVVAVAPEAVREEAASLFGRPEAAAASATWDIDVASYASHERVQYWMDFFSGRARRHFEIYLARLGRYDSMIRTRLATAGLPQDMIYLAMIESGMNQNARSRAGAVGLWQFIPGTARRYGLVVDAWVDERRDPYRATDAAIRFLTELNSRFGSLYLAAAAYNSGPGKIQRGLQRYDFGALNGDDRYFALSEGTFLRRETRDYVPKLIAAALLAKEPERWGFTGIQPWAPLRYDSVRVSFAVGLDVLGRLAGTTRDAMEEMNPYLYRAVTPPDRTVWLRVPMGAADSVAARLAALPPGERITVLVHYVSRGETLSRIARRYGVSVTDITSANRGVQARRLRSGQRLVIPTSLGGRGVGAAERRDGGTVGRRSSRVTRMVHIVRQGETLSEIAEQFGVSVIALVRENRLTSSRIRVGQGLRIPN